MIGNIRISCLLSFTICIAGAVLLVLMRRRAAETAVSEGYTDIFAESEDLIETEETGEEENEQNN